MSDQLPSFLEDHISQIPALQLLQNLGYSYLTPGETVSLRGGKLSGVVLDGVLIPQLRKLNKIRFKGDEYEFSESNIQSAIQAIKDVLYDCLAPVGTVYSTFHLDIGCGDAVVGQPELLVGDDLLKFADIETAKVLAIPTAQQFAEKIHAYTFPWVGRTNSRTKDLVDLLLLIERGSPVPGEIRNALMATFATRNTHPIPPSLDPPPEAWKNDFISMAEEAGISTMDYLVGFAKIETYWEKERLSG